MSERKPQRRKHKQQHIKSGVTTQHGIILNINEQLEEVLKENKILKKCYEEMKCKSTQHENNVRFLKAENEKLQKKLSRVIKEHVEIEDWKVDKQKLTNTIDKLNKDILHYQCQQMKSKDKKMAVSKREEEIIKENKEKQQQQDNMNTVMIPLRTVQRHNGITTSQQIEHPDANANQQILLLKSIITELQQENRQLQQKNIFYEKQAHLASTPHQQANISPHDDDGNNNDNGNEIQVSQANQSKLALPSPPFTLSFQDILTFNAEHKNLTEHSIQELCSFIFSQYANNMEADNDDDTKNKIIELLTNTLAISFYCDSSFECKSDLTQFLTQLYDSDEDDSFKNNFYNLFHNVQTHLTNVSRDNEIKSIVVTKLLVNRKLIDNIIESFPRTINVNVLNELLH